MSYFTFFFRAFETWHVFCTWSTSQFGLLTFQVLRSHMWTQIGLSRSLSPCSLAPACFLNLIVSLSSCGTHIPNLSLCNFLCEVWERMWQRVENPTPGKEFSEIAQQSHLHLPFYPAELSGVEPLLRRWPWGSPSLVCSSRVTHDFWESEGNKMEKHW